MARAVVVAVLACVALAVAAPAPAELDQPRRHGSALEHRRAVGPTPPFGGAALPLPPCARETMARVERFAALLRRLPLGGVLAALADPERVCVRAP